MREEHSSLPIIFLNYGYEFEYGFEVEFCRLDQEEVEDCYYVFSMKSQEKIEDNLSS